MAVRERREEGQRQKAARLFKFAEKQGVIVPGWSCIDYMRHAVANHGWESTCVSGPKGTMKSNLVLQHGLAIYGNMTIVMEHFVTQRKQLLSLMENAINKEICIPWIGVDDIGALFPKSLYFTHRKLYSKLQASWETVRTVMTNFEFSCVLKRKVAGFILEDITGDIKCYNPVLVNGYPIKSHYDYRRWLWLRNLKDPTTDIAKLIAVEDIPFPATPDAFKIDKDLKSGKFVCGGKTYEGEQFYREHACLHGIEVEEFKKYWNNRLSIAKTSFHDFVSILEETPKQPKHTPEEVSKLRSEAGKKGMESRYSKTTEES